MAYNAIFRRRLSDAPDARNVNDAKAKLEAGISSLHLFGNKPMGDEELYTCFYVSEKWLCRYGRITKVT